MKAYYWGKIQCNTEAGTTTSTVKKKTVEEGIVHVHW